MNRKTILLSTYLQVERTDLERAGVFDATIGLDTPLFVDPKLIVGTDIPEFKLAREKILQYFAKLLKIHKQSANSSRLRDITIGMLATSEPVGLSIGYGSKTDKGTSVPKKVAKKILHSASEMMAIGIEDVEIIELLGLFVDGFGPDSISDLIITIIYDDLCLYTERISKDLGLEVEEFEINETKYNLPTHPNKKEQLIFVPFSFLDTLPVATSWQEVANAARHSRELRNKFNGLIFPVLKEEVQEITSKSPEQIADFKSNINSLLEIYKSAEVHPYDLHKDDRGYYNLGPYVESEATKLVPKLQPSNADELIISIRDFIAQYKRSIEDNGGNNLLYRTSDRGKLLPDKPHNEDVAQRLFYLLADPYCKQANILLSGESDAGKGPVDFSLGTGYDKKVLVEIKKSENTNLIDGFKKQIESYHKSENALHSFYVVILIKEIPDKRRYPHKLDIVSELYKQNLALGKATPELIIIDGLIYPSPSKL